MRICSVCMQELELDKFYKKRNSYEGFCKACKDKKRKVRLASDPSIYQRIEEKRKKRIEQNLDVAEAMKRYFAEYYQLNKEKCNKVNKEWYRKNPNKRLIVQQNWQQNNKGAVRFHANKRRVAKLKATPKWADNEWEQFLIEEMYDLASLKQKIFNLEFHVDHIVPLQSKFVCGLHCSDNLQVISGKENSIKSNKYWPDMWVDENMEKQIGT